MEIFEPLGHRPMAEKLWGAARDTRLPHAILFEGPEGIGKFALLKWFAAGLFCSQGPGAPCGSCGPCKRVTSGGEQGNHGDLFTIDPVSDGEERIKVARIAIRSDGTGAENNACLERFLDLTSVEGGVRVVLIRECQRMNDAAQNALLKTLEEPRPGTLILMETHRPLGLLSTIRSRCISVRLDALNIDQCAQVLAGQGLEFALAAALARMVEGSPGRAIAWHRQGAMGFRRALLECMHGQIQPLAMAPGLWELEGEFEGDKPTAKARARARFVVELALGLLQDQRRAAQGIPIKLLPHGDVVRLDRRRYDPLTSSRAREGLLTCRADIDRNLTPEAILERAMMCLAGSGHAVGAR
jgi:DNA polymerase III delta' subunit